MKPERISPECLVPKGIKTKDLPAPFHHLVRIAGYGRIETGRRCFCAGRRLPLIVTLAPGAIADRRERQNEKHTQYGTGQHGIFPKHLFRRVDDGKTLLACGRNKSFIGNPEFDGLTQLFLKP